MSSGHSVYYYYRLLDKTIDDHILSTSQCKVVFRHTTTRMVAELAAGGQLSLYYSLHSTAHSGGLLRWTTIRVQ